MRVKRSVIRWRTNFVAGLAVVLPAVVSAAIFLWLFGTVSNVTDKLLFLVPKEWKFVDGTSGDIHWYWSLVALLLAILMISVVGQFARYYIGKKMIQFFEGAILRVPLLNKIYGAIKQVNEAFTTNNKSSFKQVVLVQFPREGMHSVGFITNENHAEIQAKTEEEIISVFVPTTPNPTTGFLIMVPNSQVKRLQMSVSDGVKFIISLGSVSPTYRASTPALPVGAEVPVLPPDKKEELEKLVANAD